MKARPILFNTDMVKAILSGRKTQTRREIKPQPELVTESHDAGFRKYWTYKGADITGKKSNFIESCPFGQPGDLLCFKEPAWMWCEKKPNGITPTGRQKYHYRPLESAPVFYQADHPSKPAISIVSPDTGNEWVWRLKIGRFLPRWASRLTLEITDVRVERLQDIDRGDCMAEGCPFPNMAVNDPIGWFSGLWDSIYGNWHANPWVWVVEFKVHHCNVDARLREREAA